MSKPDKITQGAKFSFKSEKYEPKEILNHAIDYRGDIELHLASGEVIEGFLFNQNLETETPHVTLYPKKSPEKRKVYLEEITEICFSGRDTAEGKKWEAWAKKHQEREEARTRGETFAEDINLYPEDLNSTD